MDVVQIGVIVRVAAATTLLSLAALLWRNERAGLPAALTALPSFIAIWTGARTGSLLLPVRLHNFGNSISFMV